MIQVEIKTLEFETFEIYIRLNEKMHNVNKQPQNMLEKVFVDEVNRFYCPICEQINYGSKYLKTVFQDQRTLWLANMVTHYRHRHTSWDSYCFYLGKFYDFEKQEKNEEAKRGIVRLATQFLKENDFKLSHFTSLQNSSSQTIDTVKKILGPELSDLIRQSKNEIIHSRIGRGLDYAKRKHLLQA